MNGDHPEDNLLIVRAYGHPEATASTMVGVTGDAGVWSVTDPSGTREVSVAWPGGPITERPEIRREVVKMYKEACARLGVPAREEHAPSAAPAQGAGHGSADGSAHGSAHGHGASGGHGHGHAPEGSEQAGEKSFSTVVRESSWSDHSDSEGATFMEDIMKGVGTRQDYIDLVAQHFFMYEALEAAAAQLPPQDREVFHPAALVRMPALVEDLEYLIGADWRDRIAPVPATAAYAARIREIAEEGWVAGIVAHHYTRYLGDLSGGQMIAKRVARQHEFSREGVAFYDFTELGSIPAFKAGYRDALDSLGETLDADEQKRMLDEVRTAYHFNTAVFVDLGTQKQQRAA